MRVILFFSILEMHQSANNASKAQKVINFNDKNALLAQIRPTLTAKTSTASGHAPGTAPGHAPYVQQPQSANAAKVRRR